MIAVYTALTEGQFVPDTDVVTVPEEFILERVNASGQWIYFAALFLLYYVCTVLRSNVLYRKYTLDTLRYVITVLYVLYGVQFMYSTCYDPLYCQTCLVCIMLKGTPILYFLSEVRILVYP